MRRRKDRLAEQAPPTARFPSANSSAHEQPTMRMGMGAPGTTVSTSNAGSPIAQQRAPVAIRDGSASRQLAPREASNASGVLIRGASKAPRPVTHIVPRRSGPRSAAAQFIGGMVVVMVLFSGVTLATPLGQTAGITSSFKVYANALPWVPTPTPTPRPVPPQAPFQPPQVANPGTQAIINDIVAVFGSNAQGALNVARCESGYDPNAWNSYPIGNSHAAGVFQILYPSTWDGTSYAAYSPFNADANIHAAYQLFQRDGYTWREWACQP
jgi:hypothetical protein